MIDDVENEVRGALYNDVGCSYMFNHSEEHVSIRLNIDRLLFKLSFNFLKESCFGCFSLRNNFLKLKIIFLCLKISLTPKSPKQLFIFH